jgi:HEPN domain-containing protein
MPRDLPDSTDPKRWMRRVYSNLARARDVSGVPEVLYEDLCFDVQQSVEKAIKAVLLAHNVPFPKTHAIAELVTLLERKKVFDSRAMPWRPDTRGWRKK